MCVDGDVSPGLLAEVTPLLSQQMLKQTCRLHALSASGGLSMGPVSQVPLGLLPLWAHGASPVSWLDPSHLASRCCHSAPSAPDTLSPALPHFRNQLWWLSLANCPLTPQKGRFPISNLWARSPSRLPPGTPAPGVRVASLLSLLARRCLGADRGPEPASLSGFHSERDCVLPCLPPQAEHSRRSM